MEVNVLSRAALTKDKDELESRKMDTYDVASFSNRNSFSDAASSDGA